MRFSIITVVYNAVDTLERTIVSVLSQEGVEIEYIIIDGGSTDGTVDIIKKYESKIAYWVSEPDRGVYDAMNKGIEQSSGDIIGIINGDDWYSPQILIDIEKFFDTNEVDAVYGDMMIVNPDGNEHTFERREINTIWYRMIPHPTVFIKKKCYDEFGVFNTKYRVVADYELVLRMYTRGVIFGRLDRIVAHFSKGGLSDIEHTRAVEEMTNIALEYVELSPNPEAMKTIIQKSYENLMVENKDNIIKRQMLLDILGGNDEVIIWGTGKYGTKLFDLLEMNGIKLIGWIDNDCDKWNSKKNDIEIYPPDFLKTFGRTVIIAISGHYYTDIKEQIENNYPQIKPLFIQDIYRNL